MNAFEFGTHMAEKMAFGGGAAFTSRPPVPPKPVTQQPVAKLNGQARSAPSTFTSAAPSNKNNTWWSNMPSGGQMLSDMSNNAARVGGGILSTVAGGIGTAATGAVAGATNAWNAVTPKSMNTSKGWSQGANDVFNKAVNFTQAGAKDVYGGLGGDTNYSTQHAWNAMEKGFNDPAVPRWAQNTAWAAGHAGHGAWNVAQTVANPGKILANMPRAGINPLTWARQGSRIMPGARGGIQTAATAQRALPQFGAAGRGLNLIDDWGTSSVETANTVNQGINTVRRNLASRAQQPEDNTYAYAQ